MSSFARRSLALASFLTSLLVLASAQGEARLVLPASFRQGEALLALVLSPRPLAELSGEIRSPSGLIQDGAAAFELPREAGSFRYGLALALDPAAPPGTYTVTVRGLRQVAGGEERAKASDLFSLAGKLRLERRTYFSERIPLNEANTAIRTVPDPRKVAEAKALFELLGRVDQSEVHEPSAYFFPVPPTTRRSANFGDRRTYIYAKGEPELSLHAGMDLAIALDSPVFACAAGRVVFAGMRIVTGNTVVVEHLPGLYSLYMHLSRIEVAPGDLLTAGAELGRSGSTGLSTGPHLHFELRLHGKPVDPAAWLRTGSE